MNILLVGNGTPYEDPEAYYGEYKEFFERAVGHSKTESTVKFTLIDDLVISVGDGEFSVYDARNQADLADYQLIIIRGRGFRQIFGAIKAVSSYAKSKNIPVVNDYTGFRDSSKLTQAVQFFELGLPVARTVFVTEAVLGEKAPLGFDFPCIMKATFGAHGNDNYLVNSMTEARETAVKYPDIDFVLQRFVPNNNDYRLLVIGNETLVISRSAVDGTHLNNTSQGGQAVIVANSELPNEIIDGARKIMHHLDMTMAGVDVLADKNTGEFFFLEVNSQPQIMSGAFVEEKAKAVGRFLDSFQA